MGIIYRNMVINPELSKVILGLKNPKISSFEYNKKYYNKNDLNSIKLNYEIYSEIGLKDSLGTPLLAPVNKL